MMLGSHLHSKTAVCVLQHEKSERSREGGNFVQSREDGGVMGTSKKHCPGVTGACS